MHPFAAGQKYVVRRDVYGLPPFCKDFALNDKGQDCCRISGLFLEESIPPGLNDFRAYRPHRDHGFYEPSSRPGFRYAGLTCFVISVDKAFAIPGGNPPFLPSVHLDQLPNYVEAG